MTTLTPLALAVPPERPVRAVRHDLAAGLGVEPAKVPRVTQARTQEGW
jgi:hypothetical protein